MQSFSAFADNFPGYVFRCSRDYRILFMNRWMIDRVGVEAAGGYCYKALHKMDAPCSWCVNERVFAGETVHQQVYSVRQDRWFKGVSAPVAGPGGAILKEAIVWDVTESKLTELALAKCRLDVQEQVRDIEEVNMALGLLLKRREEDRKKVYASITANVAETILPYLERLKNTKLDRRQKFYLDILEVNLRGMTSPFVSLLCAEPSSITPMEVQVAGLVREGRTAKEIADLLCLSVNTIRTHKSNLRRKLGLRKKKSNLRIHLQAIKED